MVLSRMFRRTAALSALVITGAFAIAAQSQETAPQSDPKNGQLAVPMAVSWKFSTTYAPNNPASPTVEGDTVYFSSGNRVYAVDKNTGAQKWRYPSDTTLNTFIAATPAVADGTVFVSAGDGLYALNTADGRPRWPNINIKGGALTSPLVVGDTVYFASTNGRMYAIDVKTGASRGGVWSQGNQEGLEIGDLVADIAYADEMVYFVTSDEILSGMSLSSGTRKWAQRIGAADTRISEPIISGETIYVAAGSNLLNFRRNNGQARWNIPFPNSIVAPPAVDANGVAYVVTGDRAVYAVDSRGRGLWRQPAMVDYEVLAQPLVVGDVLFVTTTLGNVYAFDTATGALKWNYAIQPSSANPGSVPSITNVAAQPVAVNGTLYVLSDDGALTAFRNDAADSLPPNITRLEPDQGEYLNGRPPFRISAKILDEGSGINLDTLALKLDDRTLPRRQPGREFADKPGFAYNPDTGLVEYNIFDTSGEGRAEILKDGHHTVTLSVKDWMGNTLNKTWTFYVDDTLRKRSRTASGTQRQPGLQGGSGSGPGGEAGGKLGGGN